MERRYLSGRRSTINSKNPEANYKLALKSPVRARLNRRIRDNIAGYGFISLNLLGFLAFSLYPMLYSIQLSLSKWNLFGPSEFIGFENYRQLLSDDIFWKAFANTLYFMLLSIVPNILVALGLAIVLNQKIKGRTIFRALYFAPVIAPMIATAYLWRWLYNPDFGLLNYCLSFLGVNGPAWLSDKRWAMPAVALMSVWKGAGYNMVLFLAGLQNIPQVYYEAAELDGANGWQKFRSITLPLLSTTTFFIIIMSLISSFQVFGQVYVMTAGGPANSTMVIVYYLYQMAFVHLKMGYGSSVAWIMFFVLFVLTLIQFRYSRKWVHY